MQLKKIEMPYLKGKFHLLIWQQGVGYTEALNVAKSLATSALGKL
jgi:hypothetical protein